MPRTMTPRKKMLNAQISDALSIVDTRNPRSTSEDWQMALNRIDQSIPIGMPSDSCQGALGRTDQSIPMELTKYHYYGT